MNKILMAGITGLATIGTMGIYQEVNACGVGYEEFVVTADSLNVRSGPGTGYSIIGSVKKGQKFVPFEAEYNGTWGKIKLPNGKKGWICMKYMKSMDNCTEENNSSTSQSKEESFEGKVTASSLRVRYGAGTNYSVKSSLPKGTKVDVIFETKGWYYIEYGKAGRYDHGYVAKDYVSPLNNSNNIALKADQYRISANSVRLRQAHFMERSFGFLEKGDVVELVGRPFKFEGRVYYNVKVVKSKNVKLQGKEGGCVALQLLTK